MTHTQRNMKTHKVNEVHLLQTEDSGHCRPLLSVCVHVCVYLYVCVQLLISLWQTAFPPQHQMHTTLPDILKYLMNTHTQSCADVHEHNAIT